MEPKDYIEKINALGMGEFRRQRICHLIDEKDEKPKRNMISEE